jgi:hypothetical protein
MFRNFNLIFFSQYFLTYRHVLMSLNRDTGERQIVAGKCEFTILNPSPVDGSFSKCRLHFPRSLAADCGHRLYFAEWFERRVRFFDLKEQTVGTFKKFKFSHGNTASVSVDQTGRLFVTTWNSSALHIAQDAQPKPEVRTICDRFRDECLGVDVDALGNAYTCDASGEIFQFSPLKRDVLVPGSNAVRLIPQLTRNGFAAPDPTQQVMASFSALALPETKRPPPIAPRPSERKVTSTAPKVPPRPNASSSNLPAASSSSYSSSAPGAGAVRAKTNSTFGESSFEYC